MTITLHSIDGKGALDSPPVPAPAEAGGSAHTTGLPATPVTTERRTPATRIQAGDHCRHVDGLRDGLVTATDGLTAIVQWTEGGSESLAWGYIEKIPTALETP